VQVEVGDSAGSANHATGDRTTDGAHLRVTSMFSLEPFTLRDIGSPQVFQTGETFHRTALIDYQHPHDLLMALGGELRLPIGPPRQWSAQIWWGRQQSGRRRTCIDPLLSTIRRRRCRIIISIPLTSRLACCVGGWLRMASRSRDRSFTAANRTRTGSMSTSERSIRMPHVWDGHAAWSAQASGAFLTKPELVTPYDAKRLTASLEYFKGDERSLAWMAAFGQNREIHGNLEAYLFEATLRTSPRSVYYTRLESVAKDIFDVGFHPVNTFHRHRQSNVGAFTIGYLRDVLRRPYGTFGVGADVTGYRVPRSLEENYGSPVSAHLFLRYRAQMPGHPIAHVH